MYKRQEHEGKDYYDKLVEFITGGPALVTVVEGPEDTWQVVRTLMGATNAKEAAPGTIRGDLSVGWRENLVHGSDSVSYTHLDVYKRQRQHRRTGGPSL